MFQLRIAALSLSSEPSVAAVILRRRGVLEDLFPGDSDFDITCLLDSSDNSFPEDIERCVKIYRRIQIICPMFQEIKFLHQETFLLSMLFADGGYDKIDESNFLYKKKSSSLQIPSPRHFGGLMQKTATFLLFDLIKSLFPKRKIPELSKRFFDRSIAKICIRIKNFIGMYSDRIIKSRNYRHAFLNVDFYSMTRGRQNQMLDQIFTMLSPGIIREEPSDIIKIHCQGNTEPLPSPLLDQMKSAARLFSRARFSEIEQISIFNFRPYKTCRIFLIRLNNRENWHRNDRLLKQVLDSAHYFKRDYFSAAHPVLLNGSQWEFVKKADPLLNYLYAHGHWLWKDGDFTLKQTHENQISKSAVQYETVKTAELLTSVIRRQDTFYLLDLLFGHLMPFKYLLDNGVYFASFNALWDSKIKSMNLTSAQAELVGLYRDSNADALEKIRTLEAWKIFSPIILREINEARELILGGVNN